MGIIIFDGKASSDVGIHVSKAPDYESPTKIYESIEVPGKNGDILVPSGSYSNVEGKYNVSFYSGEKKETFYQMVAKIMEWLYANEGYRKLEDSYSPDYYRFGICSSPIDVENILAQAGQFDLVFNCRPERFLKSGDNSSEKEITVSKSIDLTKIEGGYNIAHNTNGLDIDPSHDYWEIWTPNVGSVEFVMDFTNAYTSFLSNIASRSKSAFFLCPDSSNQLSFGRSFYVEKGETYLISFDCGEISSDSESNPSDGHIIIYNSDGTKEWDDNFNDTVSIPNNNNSLYCREITPNGTKITLQFHIDPSNYGDGYFISNLMLTKKITYDYSQVTPTFSENENYSIGDYVCYNSGIYKCIKAHSARPWNEYHFKRQILDCLPWSMASDEFWCTGDNILLDTNKQNINKLSSWTIGPNYVEFSENENYSIGDYVCYNSGIYKCIEAHSAGPWNSDHFIMLLDTKTENVVPLKSPNTLSGITYRFTKNQNEELKPYIRQQVSGLYIEDKTKNLELSLKYINLAKELEGDSRAQIVYKFYYNSPYGEDLTADEIKVAEENGYKFNGEEKSLSKVIYFPTTITSFSTLNEFLSHETLVFLKVSSFAIYVATSGYLNSDKSDASLYISDLCVSPIDSENDVVEWSSCKRNIEVDVDRAEQQELITLYNPTRFESSPIIKIYGQYDYLGNISSPESKSELALIVNGYRIDIWKLDGELTIDGQLMDVYKGNTNYNMYVGFQNGFPKLDPGENKIKIELPDKTSYQGKTFKVEVIPKWWTL